jgi:hypothetical protein
MEQVVADGAFVLIILTLAGYQFPCDTVNHSMDVIN